MKFEVFCPVIKKVLNLGFATPFILLLFALPARAQLTVQEALDQNDVNNLVNNVLLNSCINISNIQYTGAFRAIGSFDGTASNIGLNSGIIITNGRANNALGPNNMANRSTNNALPGDAQLTAIAGTNTFDASILEFDFIPYSDTIQFEYIFASEEYNEYVGLFNDPMAFFITGPGFGTPYNMARVPGTTTPVSINTVNNGYNASCPSTGPCTNCAYYFDNCGGVTVQYDGFTVPMRAFAVVQPCQTYHIKIGIADALDRIYDSAVLLKAGSFSAGDAANVELSLLNGVSSIYEGCSGGFVFTRIDPDNTQSVTVSYTVSGSATNGTDYNNISNSITIPAGQNSVTLPINAILDGNAEPNETVIISLSSSGCTCQSPPTATLTIVNNTTLTASTSGGGTICLGQSALLTATASGSQGPYTYTWNNGAGSGTTVSVSPTQTTTYTVTITDGCNGQTATAQQTVTVITAGFTIAGASPQCLNGNTFTFTNTGSSGSGINHTWNFGDGSPLETTTNATHSYATAGTFTITHTVSDGVCTVSTTQNITVTGSPTAVISGANGICAGNNTVLSAAGSTPGSGTVSSYQWQINGTNIGGAISSTYTASTAGNYTVVVTNSEGCSAVSAVFAVSVSNNPTAVISGSNSFCAGNNTVLTAAGSTPGSGTISSYQWQLDGSNISGANLSTYTATDAGNYTVTVTNSFGCFATSTSFNVTVFANPTSIITGNNSFCTGSNTILSGTNSTAGSGTVLGYQWQLNGSNIPGANDSTYSANADGNYTLIVTNSNGCSTVSAVFAVTENSNPSVLITSSTDVSCSGDNNGTATASASGGSGTYTYLWQPGGQTSSAPNNLSAGINIVTVTDINGCMASASVNILTVDNTPPIANCQDITVFLNPLGTATVTAAQINNGSSDNCGIANISVTPNAFNCTNLGANTVTLIVTDGSGNTATCTATVTVEYSNPPVPDCGNITAWLSTAGTVTINENDIITNLPALCGIATVSLSQTEFDCSELGANTVEFTVTYTTGDVASCSATITVSDTINPVIANCPADISTTPNMAGCLAQVSWNLPQFSDNCEYVVTNSHNSGDSFPVGTTLVTYTVSDPAGNTTQCSFQVEVISVPLSLSLVPSLFQCGYNISCANMNDGNITSTITGGCPPYTYLWNSGETTSSLNNLFAGTYQLTVTDANGDVASQTITLTQPLPLATSSTQLSNYPGGLNISCNGAADGSISTDFTGGASCADYNYSWTGHNGFSSTAQNISGLEAGDYFLVVTDENGCVHNQSFTLSQPAAINITATNTGDVSCFGFTDGTATVTASGGASPYSFLWSNGETTSQANQLSAGTNTVFVTDANGCVDSIQINIQQPAELLANISVISNFSGFAISCFDATDGSLSVSASGGLAPYSYSWQNSETTQNISNLSAGNYSVTVTDNNGCVVISSVQLVSPEMLSTSFAVQQPLCNGSANGSVEIIPSGGVLPYSFLWSNGETTQPISNLSAGNYSVTITDANGCVSVADTVLSEPVIIDAQTTLVTDVSCFGFADGAIDVSVTGGTPPYFYTWSNGNSTQDLQNLAAGVYTLYVRDANACYDTLIVTINQPAEIVIIVENPSTVCPGTETILSANASGGNGNFTYSWSNGQSGQTISIFPQQPVTLGVTATDALGCSATFTGINISLYPLPTANFGLSLGQSCTYPVQVSTFNNSNGAAQYNWQISNGINYTTQNPVLTFNAVGEYNIVLIVTNGAGCSDTASQIFTVYQNPTAAFSLSANQGCPPLSVDFINNSQGALQYSWSFGDNNSTSLSNPSHLYSQNGEYDVTLIVTGTGGCTDTLTIPSAVTVFPVPLAGFTWDYEDPYDPDGKILFTNVSTGATSYQWTFGDGNNSSQINPVNNYQSPGNYLVTLTATNQYGCTNSVSEYVEPAMDNGLYVPNALFGGASGDFGLFFPKGRGLKTYECRLFDKWGNLIWQSNKLNEGRPAEAWDGKYKGTPVPQGAYIWQITAVFDDGKIWQGIPFENGKKSTVGTVTVME